jgi:hypothetical protein
MESKDDFACGHCLSRVADWPPRPPVPHYDRAGTVLPGRNRAFERRVFKRMVFHADRYPLFLRVVTEPLG